MVKGFSAVIKRQVLFYPMCIQASGFLVRVRPEMAHLARVHKAANAEIGREVTLLNGH
jgi:hypothetical protein